MWDKVVDEANLGVYIVWVMCRVSELLKIEKQLLGTATAIYLPPAADGAVESQREWKTPPHTHVPRSLLVAIQSRPHLVLHYPSCTKLYHPHFRNMDRQQCDCIVFEDAGELFVCRGYQFVR